MRTKLIKEEMKLGWNGDGEIKGGNRKKKSNVRIERQRKKDRWKRNKGKSQIKEQNRQRRKKEG
jgi:hypothetical protein